MILPVTVYGNPILKKEASPVEKNYEGLQELIANMFETMYHANGLGLAAPQVDLSLKLFVVDTSPLIDEDFDEEPFKAVFINAEILEFFGEDKVFNEGCLSVPEINENVVRKSKIRIKYQDEHFVEHTKVFEGLAARVIQHEYDHTLGKVFVERLSNLKKTLLKGKLNDIACGKKVPFYKIKPNKK
ncbi:MAG: peptide deformylase [Bacteroidales bacterium]|jgi:peptide deformylase|nr:peptide deformylase [Bacteroidales bacterium]MDD2687371.1 peptide deformylase [Bacteroidales bacterium]MDD3330281.1 peptide deformylase [Bacteroidales bacterium]MDD3690570.1 peptide deformylase [Bacteroidales bacterium]MDD4043875.1 peptide deformylase [Bacteroidales bacterium]